MSPSRLASLILPLLPLAFAGAEPLHVSGRLLASARGSGAQGVAVELFPAWEEKSRPAPLATARTDGEGVFELAAPDSGLFRLTAKAAGFEPMEYLLVLVEDRDLGSASLQKAEPQEAPPPGPTSLPDVLGMPDLDRAGRWHTTKPSGPTGAASAAPAEPPRRISGRVIDAATQRPVAGALVWSGWPLAAPETRTNADGLFQLAVPPRAEVRLRAAAAGYLSTGPQYVKAGSNDRSTLSLRPAATLSGTVVDGASKPIAGAQVQTVFLLQGELSSVFARSRADGGFRLSGLLPAGAYRILADRQGYARSTLSARTAPPGKVSAPIRVVLTGGQTGFGRVVDEAGRPVAGAEVGMVSAAGDKNVLGESWQGFTVKTDAEGRFELQHLNPGTFSLGAAHPGYLAAELREVQIPPKPLRVDLGTLTLPSGVAIEGQVTDTRGAPIAGARVWSSLHEGQNNLTIFVNTRNSDDRLHEVEAGPDGRFRIPDLQRGRHFDLGATHPGHVDAFVLGVLAPSEEAVRIEMKTAHALRGQVVGPTGEPVVGAALSRALGLETLFGAEIADPFHPLGVTDAEGRFALTGLAAGKLELQVRADGYQSRRLDGVEIPEDRDPSDLKIALERGAWLAVRVLESDGEPVRGAAVTAMADEKTMERYNDPFAAASMAQTDAEGNCRVGLPGPGTYQVSVLSMRGESSRPVKAGLGATAVELRFPQGTEVSGRVLDADGSTVSGASLQLSGGEHGIYQALSDADGTFLITRVADGRYVLTARSQGETGRSAASLEVEVSGQPVRNLDLQLDREKSAVVLTGRLLGLAPGEWREIVVVAQGENAQIEMGKADPEGNYRVEGLSPGAWTVEAHLPLAGRLAQGKVEIEPDAASASLDLEFSATFQLTGRVLMDGGPLAGALVLAQSQPEGSFTQAVRTTADGSFKIDQVPAGELAVAVVGSEPVADARKIVVSGNQDISIEFSTGRLSGRIVSAAGDPVEDAAISIVGGSAEARAAIEGRGATPFSLRSGAEGTFAIPRLTAGTYSVTVEKEGFAPTQVSVEVPPGGERTVEIRLKPSASQGPP